jgi:hypothetical protein
MATTITVVMFMELPQLLAGCDVEQRDTKKENGKHDHFQVSHR